MLSMYALPSPALYIFSGERAVITIGKTGVTLSIFFDARIKYPFSSKVLWRWL
jgi:hypothetical protein